MEDRLKLILELDRSAKNPALSPEVREKRALQASQMRRIQAKRAH